MAAPPEKRAYWAGQWGSGYSPDFKKLEIRPLLERMDAAGLLGKRILDAGSGSHCKSEQVYPANGKRIVRMDIGASMPLIEIGDILQMQCDIENLSGDEVRMALSHAKGAGFDSILFIDILNYVDSQKVLSGFLELLDGGGRIVISNFPHMGIGSMFSEKRARGNGELRAMLLGLGLRIEHMHHPPIFPPWLPGAESYSRPQYPSIMPLRDNGSMILVACKA